jgi:hypothetical protein
VGHLIPTALKIDPSAFCPPRHAGPGLRRGRLRPVSTTCLCRSQESRGYRPEPVPAKAGAGMTRWVSPESRSFGRLVSDGYLAEPPLSTNNGVDRKSTLPVTPASRATPMGCGFRNIRPEKQPVVRGFPRSDALIALSLSNGRSVRKIRSEPLLIPTPRSWSGRRSPGISEARFG